MRKREVHDVAAVISELGGIRSVARLTGRTASHVHNWRYRGRFAANVYAVMIAALHERDATAPASLWGQRERQAAA